MHDRISISVLSSAAEALAETNRGLSGPVIVRYCNSYAVDHDVVIPHASYPFQASNKRAALFENLQKFPPHIQYELIMEMTEDTRIAETPEVQAVRKIIVDRYSHLSSNRRTEAKPASNESEPVVAAARPPWENPIKPLLSPPSTQEQIRPYDIFLSYSHVDEELVTFVRTHLMGLDRQNKIRKWWDRKILGGSAFSDEISVNLAQSDIILLFISASFIASDYCYNVEMTQALKQNQEGRSVVIPVILRHCDWHSTPFGKLMALPRDGRPLNAWTDRDEAAKDIAEGVARVVADLQRKKDPNDRAPH
jgi:hypothetical protein